MEDLRKIDDFEDSVKMCFENNKNKPINQNKKMLLIVFSVVSTLMAVMGIAFLICGLILGDSTLFIPASMFFIFAAIYILIGLFSYNKTKKYLNYVHLKNYEKKTGITPAILLKCRYEVLCEKLISLEYEINVIKKEVRK